MAIETDNKMTLGYSDDPAQKDSLGVDKYFKALEKYILSCPTPTTIAIQGGWGTGKSTAMGIIRDRISDKTHVIEFNTWQYSKTSGQSLVIPLLSMFKDEIDRIKNPNAKANYKKGAIGTAIHLLMLGGYAYLDKTADLGNSIDHLIAFIKGDDSVIKGDEAVYSLCEYYKQIGKIQNVLENSIDSIGDKKKFVVFIDDLDRLNPEDAVSLLEDLKTLLCIKNCVFVLALDQTIVNKGLSKKYGEGTEYSKHFFDKIIQLPFSMPINQYDIFAYIKELKGKNDFIKDEDVSGIVNILEEFGESNPRTIKRLLNILQLYSHVKDDNGNDYKYEEYIKECFAIILIQISHRDIYDLICQYVKDHAAKRSPFQWLYGIQPASDRSFWMDNFDNDPILRKLRGIFNYDFARLSDVLSMTTVTGDGNYGSKQEEAEVIADHLIEYASEVCKVEGWIKEEKPGGSVSFKKPGYADIGIVGHPEHVNLTFSGDKAQIDFLLSDAKGDLSLDRITDTYKFTAYPSTQGDLNTPYIIANISGNTGYFCLREISTRDPDSIKLAGKILREHLRK